MANVNKVILIGRLTRDPETRTVVSGSSVTDLGLAVNREWKSKDGTAQKEVCFVDVTAWGPRGEVIAKYFTKGREIYIEGHLKLDTWEKDGSKRSKLGVVLDGFEFLSGPQESSEQTGDAPGSDAIPF